MAEERPYRRTTTPIRRAQRRTFRLGRYAIVLGVAGLLALFVTRLPFSDSGIAGLVGDCAGGLCITPVAQRSAATPSPTPCPYCGQDPNAWQATATRPPPEIGGLAAVVIDGDCGKVLYGKDMRARLPPASLVKMATALVTVENGRLSDLVRSKIDGWELTARDGSSIMGLEAGMVLSVEDLLYGLMLRSGNDAALTLADYLGGVERTVALMNTRVRQLGLTDTRFTNPDGRYHPDQYSTPLDMAFLGMELLKNARLSQIVVAPAYTPRWEHGTITNTNAMLAIYPGAQGIKTGYTDQGNYTIVAATVWEGRQLVVSVFGSWNLYTDSIRLLDWAYDYTKSVCPPTQPAPGAAQPAATPVSPRP